MFNHTCSEDRESGGTCGICGDASSVIGLHPAVCGSERQRRDASTICTFCADYGNECCMPFVAADDTIHEAVSAWLDDEASARQKYGDISMWKTREVTDMSLFCTKCEYENGSMSSRPSMAT